MLRIPADRAALLICALFVASGLPWIGEVGLQNDEVLFAGGIYPPFSERPPLMVMTYVGTLKSFIYKPIFYFWKPSPTSVRVPALLLAGLTLWLFYILIKKTLGEKAALFGSVLLGSDSAFLLTSRWDWGPVVLQHLCLVAGMLSIVWFAENRKTRWLAVGFFIFGLGLWDKAIFAWSLAGLGVATLVVFPARVSSLLKIRNAAVCILALLVGTSPLIRYNLTHHGATFRDNAAWSAENLSGKAGVFRVSMDASALVGTIVRDHWDGPVREPSDALKRLCIRISDAAGNPSHNAQFWLFVLALLLSPLIWRTANGKAFFFSIVFILVTWLAMALTKDAGGSIHHIVLMWPLPHLAMAAVFSRIRWGWVALLACAVNLAFTATVYRNMLRNGGVPAWTDAITPALASLPEFQASQVCQLDWGFYEQVRLIYQGRIIPCNAEQPNTEAATRQLADAGVVYIAHPKEVEFNPGAAGAFTAFAEAQGYRKAEQRVFYDYNGRPMIEAFRFRQSTPVLDYSGLIGQWRAEREAKLKAPDGWLSVSGLVWLRPGDNRLDVPGVMTLEGDGVTFTSPDGRVKKPIKPDSGEFAESAGVKLFIIRRGDRYGVRIRDNNSAIRKNFTKLEWFPIDPSWRVQAKYVPYPQPQKAQYDSLTGDKQEVVIPGFVEFVRNGQRIRLTPTLEDNQLFFVFRDTTAGKLTYPAARFLYAQVPEPGGTVELDFNKAYNPPCAFTPFATCPLPPKENRLPLPISAGEMKYLGRSAH